MRTQDKTSIFDGLSQVVDLDPAAITPIHDRILVKDLPTEEVSAGGVSLAAAPSLQGLGKSGRIRIGEVVAIGPGDKYYQWLEHGKVKERAYRCYRCRGVGSWIDNRTLNIYTCHYCNGTGALHQPLQVSVGDRIAYDQRKEAEIFIGGVRYTLMHEGQAVFGIILPYSLCLACLWSCYSGEKCPNCGGTPEPPQTDEFQPLYDWITVEPVQPGQMEGSIHIPETAREKTKQGIVTRVGCGKRARTGALIRVGVKVGDRVLYAPHGAHQAEEITLFGEKSLIMREKQIVAVIE